MICPYLYLLLGIGQLDGNRPRNMYNETSIWFEWGAATQSNGESLVKIQHCPATVIGCNFALPKSERPPVDKYRSINLRGIR
jgi:hypothetical protein